MNDMPHPEDYANAAEPWQPPHILPNLQDILNITAALSHQAHSLAIGGQEIVADNCRNIDQLIADRRRLEIDREETWGALEATYAAGFQRIDAMIAKLQAQNDFYTGAPVPVIEAVQPQRIAPAAKPARVPLFKRLIGRAA